LRCTIKIYFIEKVDEPDAWTNIPLERRRPLLELLHRYGVHYVFAGHTHKNNSAQDGDLEMTANGPVGMAFGANHAGSVPIGDIDSGLPYSWTTDDEQTTLYWDPKYRIIDLVREGWAKKNIF
jgi:hypothetical protein